MSFETGDKPKLLFVDDEPMVVKTLSILFRRGYQVFTANSGPEALDIVHRENIDVVVSDQRMPGMTGTELLRQVRDTNPRTTRILLTGYADLDAIQQSINEGEVYRFVTKPWNNDYMRRIVAEAADHAREIEVSGGGRPAGLNSTAHAEPLQDLNNSAGRVSILVIEERSDIARLVEEMFGTTVELLSAGTARDAASLLNQREVDIVLSEMFIHGQPMAGLLHNAKLQHPAMMSIVVSEMLDFNTIQELINYVRVYRFFRKPLGKGMLKISIRSAVKQSNEIKAAPPSLRGYYSVDTHGSPS